MVKAKKRTARKKAKPSSKFGYIRFLYIGFVSIIVLGLFISFIKFSALSRFCANQISCVKDLSGTYDSKASSGEFMGQKIDLPKEIANDTTNPVSVLGDTNAPKHIYVDLSQQKLFAYEGQTQVYAFDISSGKWHPTPTGNFRIWIKLRYTRMSGGDPSIGTFYDLPNVPYTMFFEGATASRSEGYSLHGAYWHNNFGHPMSHGCVNMRIEDAHKIYDWASPATTGQTTYATDSDLGTPITIFGTTPS